MMKSPIPEIYEGFGMAFLLLEHCCSSTIDKLPGIRFGSLEWSNFAGLSEISSFLQEPVVTTFRDTVNSMIPSHELSRIQAQYFCWNSAVLRQPQLLPCFLKI